MTTHADGVYWVKWGDGGEPFLIEKRGRDWSTFGSEDDYADDSPSIEKLVVLEGPLRPPGAKHPYKAPKLTTIAQDDARAVALRAAIGIRATDHLHIAVAKSCIECGGEIAVIASHSPITKDQEDEVSRTIGGMVCISIQHFAVEVGKAARVGT